MSIQLPKLYYSLMSCGRIDLAYKMESLYWEMEDPGSADPRNAAKRLGSLLPAVHMSDSGNSAHTRSISIPYLSGIFLCFCRQSLELQLLLLAAQ